MITPDLALGRRFVEENKPPGKILLTAVTGSHHYGFPSKDSDIDLKGIHLSPTESLLGLDDSVETRDRLAIFEEVECDYTSHEAKKALSLLLAGNGNMLERILSPYQLYESDELQAFRQMTRSSISKKFIGHYRGYFRGMCAEHERSDVPNAKSLLYSYRVALTGVHLLLTGELEADLNITGPEYGFHDILELIALKREKGEKATLSKEMDSHFKRAWPKLEALLEQSRNESDLPEKPINRPEISEWLRRQRLQLLDVPQE